MGRSLRAAVAAILLLVAGAIGGVVIDRTYLQPHMSRDLQLSADQLLESLRLTAQEEARVRAVLDSMHVVVAAAARHGSDSLRASARTAHDRIEAALPTHARARFRQWLRDHHEQLMQSVTSARRHDWTPH